VHGEIPGSGSRGASPRRGRPIRRASLVVFDCDSTLSAVEGIDVLAEAEAAGEVAVLTAAAMRGELPLDAVYGRRLERVRPDRAALAGLGRTYVDTLVDDAAGVVAALRAERIAVRIVSGGLLPAVRVLARHLGLTDADVAAVDVRFDAAGRYTGYETDSPLARAGGKTDVLSAWRRALAPLHFIGDGATDLEASGAVDLFVAYAGVVERPAVTAGADIVLRARSLAPVLPLALAGHPPTAAGARALFEKGLALLDAGILDRRTPGPD
jgi:phosphoserine phosphatase